VSSSQQEIVEAQFGDMWKPRILLFMYQFRISNSISKQNLLIKEIRPRVRTLNTNRGCLIVRDVLLQFVSLSRLLQSLSVLSYFQISNSKFKSYC